MLHKLVEVLGTNIGRMFEEVDGDEGIVFRAGKRPFIALDPLRQGEGISLERVIPYSSAISFSATSIISKGAARATGRSATLAKRSAMSSPVRSNSPWGKRTFQLKMGDAFAFRSELPHHYRNTGTVRASIFWVNTPPTSDGGSGRVAPALVVSLDCGS